MESKGSFRRFRNYFLSGLLVVVPIGVTIWIVWNIFSLFDNWFQNLIEYFNFREWSGYWLPQHGLGFLLTIFMIAMLGFTTQLYIGRKIFELVEFLFLRIPVISNIYKALKQVSEALMGRRSKIFEQVVLLEYPRKGIYSLAFVTAKDQGRINQILKNKLIYVFIPTTPNPTSGYFLIVPEEECIPLNLSVEDAMKMVISSGMVAPSVPIETEELDVTTPENLEKYKVNF